MSVVSNQLMDIAEQAKDANWDGCAVLISRDRMHVMAVDHIADADIDATLRSFVILMYEELFPSKPLPLNFKRREYKKRSA